VLLSGRAARGDIRDGLWVRLVDVGAALAARSYTPDGSVVVEVVDRFCPWKELIVYHRLHVMDHVQQIATIKADPGYPAD